MVLLCTMGSSGWLFILGMSYSHKWGCYKKIWTVEGAFLLSHSRFCAAEIEWYASVTLRDIRHRTFRAQNVGNFRDTA